MVDYNKPTTPEDILRRVQGTNASSSAYLKKLITANTTAIANTDAYIIDFANVVAESFENVQNQLDGVIETYFNEGIPTLENYPANEWEESEYNEHLGDLYYDKDTGYAYRFSVDSDGVYSWYQIIDSDVTEALAVANAAQDTADSKRRVFVNTPYTPYDVGDLWIDDDTTLYRCSVARSSGEFSNTDFVIATDYTNDDYAKGVEAVLDDYKVYVGNVYSTKEEFTEFGETFSTSIVDLQTELTDTANELNDSIDDTSEELQNQIDTKTETYFLSGEPTLTNSPYIDWENVSTHIGDLYYDEDTGYAYMFLYSSNTYTWERIKDEDITAALNQANTALDTADSKRRIFTDIPFTPYDIGDLWTKNDTDLYRCSVEKENGNFDEDDWILATDYTNDDYAKDVEIVLDNFKEVVETDYVTNSTFTTSVDSINASVESVTTITEEITTNVETISGVVSDNTSEIENLTETVTATITEVTEITNSVNQTLTNMYSKTEVQELITNGTVSNLENLTVKIDITGQTVDSLNSSTKTVMQPDNFSILDKTGSSDSTLFTAKFDEDSGETVVESDNLTVDRYINLMKVGRIEKYTDENNNVGPALFLV